jgi:hypothetical protein
LISALTPASHFLKISRNSPASFCAIASETEASAHAPRRHEYGCDLLAIHVELLQAG